jgi:hypothetical protein
MFSIAPIIWLMGAESLSYNSIDVPMLAITLHHPFLVLFEGGLPIRPPIYLFFDFIFFASAFSFSILTLIDAMTKAFSFSSILLKVEGKM